MSRASLVSEDTYVFRKWLIEGGASFHECVYLQPNSSGLSVHTKDNLASDTVIASCPFSLVITTDVARAPLQKFCQLSRDAQQAMSERQLICIYITLHWLVFPEEDIECLLRHRPYIDILPKADTLRTPLFFTQDELEVFKGTNLYWATLDQKSTWEAEWQSVVTAIRGGALALADRFTWRMYLTAATYLSSRAFPSTLLSATPSLVATPSSYPVLLPGIDALNHTRGQAVTWQITRSSARSVISSAGHGGVKEATGELCISLVLNTPSVGGQELFNNYGPKPNSSFILGYGFSLPDNLDDTILLKIGSAGPNSESEPSRSTASVGYEIGRNAKGAEALWEEVQARVATEFVDDDQPDDNNGEGEGEQEKELHIKLETADVLCDMIVSHISRLPDLSQDLASMNIRNDVKMMWEHYVRGQSSILQDFLSWVEEKQQEALETAQALGIAIGDEEYDGHDIE